MLLYLKTQKRGARYSADKAKFRVRAVATDAAAQQATLSESALNFQPDRRIGRILCPEPVDSSSDCDDSVSR
jgi:hypothetical protein